MSEATVKTHARHIYEKLGVHGRRELAVFAAEAVSAGDGGRPAQARDSLAYRRRRWQGRAQDRAVVIDFCQALGAARWLRRGG